MEKTNESFEIAEKILEKISSKESFFQWEKSIELWISNWAKGIYIENNLKQWFDINKGKLEEENLFNEIISRLKELNEYVVYISLSGPIEKDVGDAIADIDGKFFVFEAKKLLTSGEWKREALDAEIEKSDDEKIKNNKNQENDNSEKLMETFEGGKGRLKLLQSIEDNPDFKLHDRCHFLVGFRKKSSSIKAVNYWNFIKKGKKAYKEKKDNKNFSFDFESELISPEDLKKFGCKKCEILRYIKCLLGSDGGWSGLIVGVSKNSATIVNINNAIEHTPKIGSKPSLKKSLGKNKI